LTPVTREHRRRGTSNRGQQPLPVPAGRDETGWPPGPLPGRRQFRGGIGNPSPRPSASAGCSPGPGDGGPSRMRAAAGRPRPATTTRASAFP